MIIYIVNNLMRKFLGLIIFLNVLFIGLNYNSAQAAGEPEITSININPNGWTADITINNATASGTFSQLNTRTNPGLLLEINSVSYDNTGATTTINRTVYASAILRKPYPNHAQRAETIIGNSIKVTVALSEYIYVDDTVSAANIANDFFINNGLSGTGLGNLATTSSVINFATEKYPLPQAVWLNHDLDRATSTNFNPKLAVMHRFGQQGQPVKAVRFIASDEHGNSVSNISNNLTTSSFASGNFANYFTAPLDFSSLTAGDIVNIDAIIYPWVGKSFQISLNGDVYPSPNLTLLKILNDYNNSYGTAYAYVNGLSGSTTKAVSTDPAAAATTPYTTIAAAASAIQAYNNSHFGRNNLGGGVIRIAASTTITGLGTDTIDTLTFDGKIPLLIEGEDKNTSVYTNSVTNINNDIPGLLKLKNLTFKKSSSTITAFDGKNKIANLLIFEDVNFDRGGQPSYAGWLIQFGRGYFINNTGEYFRQGDIFSSNIQSSVLTLGSTFLQPSAYNIIASRGNQNILQSSKLLGVAKGSLHAWNFASISSASASVVNIGGPSAGPQGTALVGNIFEQYNAAPAQSALHISADSIVTVNENMIDYGNTVVGQRSNMFYQDKGTTTVAKKGLTKHAVHWKRNTKSDLFGLNANLTGNWAIRYGVGSGFSLVVDGESSGKKTPSTSSWLGEIAAVGEKFTGMPKFIADKSTNGDKTGNGNYTPLPDSEIPFIPAGETYFAVDLFGNTINTDGTARAGAVQPVNN